MKRHIIDTWGEMCTTLLSEIPSVNITKISLSRLAPSGSNESELLTSTLHYARWIRMVQKTFLLVVKNGLPDKINNFAALKFSLIKTTEGISLASSQL